MSNLPSRRMSRRLRCVAGEESGATAVEYGLLLAFVAAVIIAVVIVLGGQVSGGFQGFVNLL